MALFGGIVIIGVILLLAFVMNAGKSNSDSWSKWK